MPIAPTRKYDPIPCPSCGQPFDSYDIYSGWSAFIPGEGTAVGSYLDGSPPARATQVGRFEALDAAVPACGCRLEGGEFSEFCKVVGAHIQARRDADLFRSL